MDLSAPLIAGIFAVAGFTLKAFIPKALDSFFSKKKTLTLSEHTLICSEVRTQISETERCLIEIRQEILWIKALSIVKSSSDEREQANLIASH